MASHGKNVNKTVSCLSGPCGRVQEFSLHDGFIGYVKLIMSGKFSVA